MMYAGTVRTTLTLDPDVAARLAELQRERGWTFKEAVNQVLRRGLGVEAGPTAGAYVMPARALGVRDGVDVDRIRDALATLDDAQRP
jgi:hypothetical protein